MLADNSDLDSKANFGASYGQEIVRNSFLTNLVFGDPRKDVGELDSTKSCQLENIIELCSTEQPMLVAIKNIIGKYQATKKKLEFAPL